MQNMYCYCWGLLASGVRGELAGMLRMSWPKAASEVAPGAEGPFSTIYPTPKDRQQHAMGEATPRPDVQELLEVRNPRPHTEYSR